MAETLHEMAVRMVRDEDGDPRCGSGCDGCPMDELRDQNGSCLVCRIAKMDNCEEQIEGLRAWAAEHPVPRYPSWQEWQKKVFPGAGDDMYPCSFLSYTECECKRSSCDECRGRPISADIAEKLGIRPITPDKPVPEHDGCEGCRYYNLEEADEPCAHCKGTAGTTEVYRARRDCYELAGGDT